ncbi:hypothetical protein GCM10010412_083840 [Nonomuraea recticatena]|uniref:Uncharacterized protein n=1 Tax=Nonomuraea recticatena TaxID=46178 RepID=A0ABP6FIU3_9ACTN
MAILESSEGWFRGLGPKGRLRGGRRIHRRVPAAGPKGRSQGRVRGVESGLGWVRQKGWEVREGGAGQTGCVRGQRPKGFQVVQGGGSAGRLQVLRAARFGVSGCG